MGLFFANPLPKLFFEGNSFVQLCHGRMKPPFDQARIPPSSVLPLLEGRLWVVGFLLVQTWGPSGTL